MRLLARVVNSPAWQSQPTHVWERLFVALYLAVVAWFTTDLGPMTAAWGGALPDVFQAARPALANIFGTFAVYSTIEYMLIASRMEEAQAQAESPAVACYRKLRRVAVRRETLWVVTFGLLGAWTSMSGIPLALGTIAWRMAYRKARARE